MEEKVKILLEERAGNRMADALNCSNDLLTLVIAILGFKSESKGFKRFAIIYTILALVDKIRMLIVNLRARSQALEILDDNEVKKETGVIAVLQKFGDIKYQFTGRVDL